MKEARVVADIRKWLAARGVLVFKYHGSVYGVKGHSDLYGVLPGGRAFFLEVKRPGQAPQPWQTAFLAQAEKHGAVTGWCDSLDGAKRTLSVHMGGT